MSVSLLSQVPSVRSEKMAQIAQGEVKLDIKKNFFVERVAKF